MKKQLEDFEMGDLQTALPAVDKLKFDIFQAQNEMFKAEREMMITKRLQGTFQYNDVAEFSVSIVMLFNYLKGMIGEKLKEHKTPVDIAMYKDLMLLEQGGLNIMHQKAPYELIKYKNYLLRYMHLCNLTNLLRKPEDPYREFELGM